MRVALAILILVVAVVTSCAPSDSTIELAADFSADKTGVVVGQAVNFSDQSSGNPTQWLWDFGDGSTSTEQNPTHAYNTMGVFTVSLTVTNLVEADTTTVNSFILVLEAPDKPIDDIRQALSLREGISLTDIEILFCVAATMDADVFAVGAIITDTRSMAFTYDANADQITAVEVDYTASTTEEISALSWAAKYTSRWTGNTILPCEITFNSGQCSLKYYDGYYIGLRWSFGWASLDLDTGILEWGVHV